MNWIYKDSIVKSHSDLPDECVGFVYVLKYASNKLYVGSKLIRSERRVKPLVGMRKNAKRLVWKELPFVNYESSSKDIPEDDELVSKEILTLHPHKKDVRYSEVCYQFKYDVLSSDKFYNKNINGTYFSPPQYL